jgi:hypothetical protein
MDISGVAPHRGSLDRGLAHQRPPPGVIFMRAVEILDGSRTVATPTNASI